MIHKSSFPDNAEEITLNFYNEIADKWVSKFAKRDSRLLCDKFLSYLPEKGHILDLGCGTGSHSKYFLEKGYKVTAIDGSKELVKYAQELTNHPVLLMKFNEINFYEVFDGIWAAASLLHVRKKDFPVLLRNNLIPSLKRKGIFYMSFKYGQGENFFNGRYFCDYDDESMKDVLKNFDNIELIEIWKTEDLSQKELPLAWLNCLIRKKN